MPGIDPNNQFVLLTAPTGKAAFNIDGNTLHSIFQIPINQNNSKGFIPLSNDQRNTLFLHSMLVKLIIIDEISMVGTKLLHYLNFRLQQIFNSDKLFGGIPIIFFGDFKQLPPVGDGWIFTPFKGGIYSPLVGNPLWELFYYYELTQIMRQKNDLDFANALNNLGNGTLTNHDINIFMSRIRNNEVEIPHDAIHLFETNQEVDFFNNTKINSNNSNAYESIAADVFIGKATPKQQEIFLKNAKALRSSETYGLSSTLLLKEGLKFMITTNINTGDGLVNGAVGILRRIDLNRKNEKYIPFRLWLEFDNIQIGKNTRRKYSVKDLLTPIDLCSKIFQYKNKRDIKIKRKQFPIKCAEAMTVYKSQGSTYTCICVHFNAKRNMSNASLYVACSRVTTLNGLYFIGNLQLKNKGMNDKVRMELNNLQTEKYLKLVNYRMLESSLNLQFMVHNVQSLNKHIFDINNDTIQLRMDLLLLVETWSISSDTFNIPNFETLFRLDSNSSSIRKPCGIICFVKPFLIYKMKLEHIYSNTETQNLNIVVINFINQYIFIIVYKSPRYNIEKFLNKLEDIISNYAHYKNLIVLGDFNIDLNVLPNNTIVNYLKRTSNLSNCLPVGISTTKGSTSIDWVFSNIAKHDLFAQVYQVSYSYHNPIYVEIASNNFGKDEHASSISDIPRTNECEQVQVENECSYSLDVNYLNDTLNEIEDLNCKLSESTIDLILKIVAGNSNFDPQSSLIFYDLVDHKVCDESKNDIQILYGGIYKSNEHWICLFYEAKTRFINIYDSLCKHSLNDHQFDILGKLYPFLTNLSSHIIFKTPKLIQSPNDNVSCGIFALYYLVLILKGYLPEEEVNIENRHNYTSILRYIRNNLKEIVIEYAKINH